ncbi:c-type cytochrome biogenesis protein CcmI [Marinobacter sp. X15-166B]|uniref:c-type cytochrome biogenesis protein CcmI n=1 Tax=Marinobacter sp. X15-166B TaxID=1897620 RepID=UPI00085BC023|nr:c-type cytochrome biogenesis protein CcmI [Marinobacter sp. X15-166B]OEY67101.1 c-type cytochrome biogenesis protein CcmI [Marinobacter sp. X15-166B]
MTTTFWLTATLLVALALAFILYPLFFNRAAKRAQSDLRNHNLMAYRSRLAELDTEYAAGLVDDDNYQQLKDELAGGLLDDVSGLETAPRAVDSRRTAAIVVVLASVLLVPAAAVYLYQQWGAMERLEQWQTMTEMSATGAGRMAQMVELTQQLRQRLEASPANPDGWAMLARSYMRIEQYADAAWAFERLAEQVDEAGARAAAWGLVAQARFFDSRGEWTAAVNGAVDTARALNPDEVNALGLLGIRSFGEQRYEDAIQYWERIVAVAPDHPQLESIREGIKQAYANLGRAMPDAAVDRPDAVSAAGVTVTIELADAFAAEVPDDTVLFVFARQPGNSSAPPLAVARLTAADLPHTLRLDDRYNMTPSARLSDAERVRVVARLSRSGNPSAQPGDWQGQAADLLEVTDDSGPDTRIVIDQRLR